MVTPTLTGATTLGKVQNEKITKTSGLIILPFPLGEDTDVEASGLGGAQSDIDIDGQIPTTPDDVDSVVSNIMSLSAGNPSAARTYVSNSFPSGISVVVMNVDIENRVGQQTVVFYSMRLTRVGGII
jgi:hypothetical protein